MLKLIVHSLDKSEEFVFERSPRIIIGHLGEKDVDVGLSDKSVTPHHLTIEYIDGEYYLFNTANDPFAAVGNNPFGKRKLLDNDLLTVGQSSILVHITHEDIANAKEASSSVSEDELSTIIDQAILSKASLLPQNDLEEDVRLSSLERELEELEELSYTSLHGEEPTKLKTEPLEIDEIDALVREVEALEWEEVQELSTYSEKAPISEQIHSRPPSPYSTGAVPSKFSEPTLEDMYEPVAPSKEKKEEEPETKKKVPSETKPTIFRINWKWWLVLLGVALLLAFFLIGGFYSHMREKHRIEEIHAAQEVADIAMALTYAKVYQIKPQNQNWSNPVFLKKNLGAILSPRYQMLARIDAQGQFSNSPYLLRIYPNHDLSQFLVIAQPAPSPFQSLFPRTTIVVDSREMELRKLKDLRELNRLIANAKSFDYLDSETSSAIIKEGELIPLNSLTLTDHKLGFSPPRSLAFLRPGAENRIYNAPRYYLFGERILNQMIALESDEYAQGALPALQQDLKELERLPNLVLYSTSGMTKAAQAQRILASIAPNSELLVGYLKVNPEGKVLSSQLLMKHAVTTSQPSRWMRSESDLALLTPNTEVKSEDLSTERFKRELNAIKTAREQVLSPLVEQITTLLNKELTEPLEDFSERFYALSDVLIKASNEQTIESSQQLRHLLTFYSDEPMEGLIKLTDAAGLHSLLANVSAPLPAFRSTIPELKQRLAAISQATSLESLDQAVQSTTLWLSLKHFPEPKVLASHQKQLYNAVIQKLSDFLFSSHAHLPSQAFVAANRSLLQAIFQHAWIKDEDTQDYFLEEFDLLVADNDKRP